MPERRDDPALKSARREACVAMLLWAACLVFSVTYCYLFGYHRDPKTLTFVFGFPDWVFWGLVAPWAICCLISIWFAFVFIEDAELGGDDTEDQIDG